MGEIEAYVNPDSPRGVGSDQLVGKVKEFIHLLDDLTQPRFRVWHGRTQGSLQEQLRNAYTSRKARSNNAPGLMRG